MEKFECNSCKKTFEAEGTKKEWNDPIYGPCMKFVANCPDCGAECNEYRVPVVQKQAEAMPAPSCGAASGEMEKKRR